MSFKLYGKTFSELHKWMDFPSITYGVNHRKFRHDSNKTPKEALELFGHLADQACLDHIILDELTSNNSPNIQSILSMSGAIKWRLFQLNRKFHYYHIISQEEITEAIGFLIGVGFTVKNIQELVGMSERSIYRYMPQELKAVVK